MLVLINYTSTVSLLLRINRVLEQLDSGCIVYYAFVHHCYAMHTQYTHYTVLITTM